jgi:hypothetical protein
MKFVILAISMLLAASNAQEGCVVPTLEQATSNCTLSPFVDSGVACEWTCADGYNVTEGDVVRACNDGAFVGADVVCTDFDACASSPCNSQKSVCVDQLPPSTSHVCQCANGHTGPDSADGEVCTIRKSITGADFGLHVLVADNEDVKFQFGTDPSLYSMHGLIDSVSTLEDLDDGPIGQLSTAVNVAMNSLRSSTQDDIEELGQSVTSNFAATNQKINNLETTVENTETSTNTRISNDETQFAAFQSQTASNFQAAATLANAISSAAASTDDNVANIMNQIDDMDGLVDEVSNAVLSNRADIATATAKADTATAKAEAANTLATSAVAGANSAQSSANSAVTTANAAQTIAAGAKSAADIAASKADNAAGKADTAYSKADSVSSQLTNIISTLGCIASGCNSGYTCNPDSKQCEVETLIGRGVVGNSIGKVIDDSTGSRWNTMCYKKSTHGSSSSTFHSRCNSKSPLLIVTKGTNGRIWGGMTTVPYVNAYSYRYSTSNYLWRYYGGTFQRTTGLSHPQYAIYDHPSYGPTFGGGHDWHISSSMSNGYSNRYSYNGNGFDDNWLAGSYSSWSVSDMEVYY